MFFTHYVFLQHYPIATKGIISWCNNNSGFVSFLLGIISILANIIAIVISVKMAQLPYKKKIRFKTYYSARFQSFKPIQDKQYHLEAINIGYAPLTIEYFGLSIKKDGQWWSLIDIMGEDSKFKKDFLPGQTISRSYHFENSIKEIIEQEPSTVVFATIKDSTGNTFRKKIGKVSDIFKKLQ